VHPSATISRRSIGRPRRTSPRNNPRATLPRAGKGARKAPPDKERRRGQGRAGLDRARRLIRSGAIENGDGHMSPTVTPASHRQSWDNRYGPRHSPRCRRWRRQRVELGSCSAKLYNAGVNNARATSAFRDVDKSAPSVTTTNSNPTSPAPAEPVKVKKLLQPLSIGPTLGFRVSGIFAPVLFSTFSKVSIQSRRLRKISGVMRLLHQRVQLNYFDHRISRRDILLRRQTLDAHLETRCAAKSASKQRLPKGSRRRRQHCHRRRGSIRLIPCPQES
jgi:hypothetical protein